MDVVDAYIPRQKKQCLTIEIGLPWRLKNNDVIDCAMHCFAPFEFSRQNGPKVRSYSCFPPTIKKACENRNKTQKLIIAGDFNAETSVVYHKSEFGGTKVIEDELCNDNGQRLKSFCRFQRFCIPQSYFEHPLSYRYTWYSCGGKTKKVLDYILLERFVNQYVQDCRVKPDNFESDH